MTIHPPHMVDQAPVLTRSQCPGGMVFSELHHKRQTDNPIEIHDAPDKQEAHQEPTAPQTEGAVFDAPSETRRVCPYASDGSRIGTDCDNV